MAAAPLFYTIASLYYPGYNLTQRGSHVVLEAEDIDSPFQLWYKDDSWRYVDDTAGNPAFALINNGSKAALQADSDAPSNLSLLYNYNRSKDTGLTTAWTLCSSSDSEATNHIFSVALNRSLRLGIGQSPPGVGDGVAAILGASTSSSEEWNLQEFVPKAYIIQTLWVDQILVAKTPHTDVTFTYGSGSFNNELTVVVVHSTNKDGEQEVWYKVPAGSPLEESSNSAFIVISKKNGKDLKGSTKSGEGDVEYQNAAYNHPLALLQVTTITSPSQWKFVDFTYS